MSTKFKGLLTKTSSVDSTSTVKSLKDNVNYSHKKIKKSNHLYHPIDYGDDDALIESGVWSDIKVLLWDFIPDYTPLNFILAHLFAYMVFLSFRAISFPSPEEPVNPDENLEVQTRYLSYIKDYFNSDEKQLQLIINTIKLVFILMLVNLFVLCFVLLVRFLIMKVLFEFFSRISRTAVLIAYSLDPAAFYFLWSLINYTIFLRFTMEVDLGEHYKTYHFNLFPNLYPYSSWIDQKCFSWTKSMYHLHILLSVRKLILSGALFMFELQFLANYSTDLTTYLNELSCLKKFTVKWLNYVFYRKSLGFKELDDLINNFLNSDSTLVKKSYNTIWSDHRKDDFKIFRPILSKWQHHNVKSDLDLNDYNGTDFLRDLCINSVSIKPTVNWIVLNYVIHNPPEIFMLHNSIRLISKETIDYSSKVLFDQIYGTLTLLKTKPHSKSIVKVPKEVEKNKEEEEDFEDDEKDEFYKYDKGDKIRTISMMDKVTNLDQVHVTSDFDPQRPRKYYTVDKVPPLMRYRKTLLDPNIPKETCMDLLMKNKEEQRKFNYEEEEEEEEDERYITKDLCLEFDQSVVDEFFLIYDISNCGSVSYENFSTNVINMCSIRKRLITTLKNQRSILELVGNLISIILWFMSFVALLLSFRINKNIVLPSTIGLFSATIVALSYMYTSFITAIMFVVISNPYNVGDRVRIDGQVMYVRRITTFNTEFCSNHGKHIIIQNILLSKSLIVNESRAKHATVELNIQMATTTTPAAMKMLRDNVKTFVNGRPRDFVNNSIFFHCNKLEVSHYINLIIWATCVETWANSRIVFTLRSELMWFVANQCKLLGITFEHPLSPIIFKNSLSLGGLDYGFGYFGNNNFDHDHKPKKDLKDLKKYRTGPPSKLSQHHPSESSDHTLPPPPPPVPAPFRKSSEEPVETQRSTGPLSIEPTFSRLGRTWTKSPATKAPPAPPTSTLKGVHKINAPSAHPIRNIPKKLEMDQYENIWLNTWSPLNKPDRLKTFSFELDEGKDKYGGTTKEGAQGVDPQRSNVEVGREKVIKSVLYLDSGFSDTTEEPVKRSSAKRSSSTKDRRSRDSLKISDEPPITDPKRKSSKTRSSSEVRKSLNEPSNTDTEPKRSSTKSKSSIDKPLNPEDKKRTSKARSSSKEPSTTDPVKRTSKNRSTSEVRLSEGHRSRESRDSELSKGSSEDRETRRRRSTSEVRSSHRSRTRDSRDSRDSKGSKDNPEPTEEGVKEKRDKDKDKKDRKRSSKEKEKEITFQIPRDSKDSNKP